MRVFDLDLELSTFPDDGVVAEFSFSEAAGKGNAAPYLPGATASHVFLNIFGVKRALSLRDDS